MHPGVLMAQSDVDGSDELESDGSGSLVGPSDREIIEVLKRVASAQAQLIHAELQAQEAAAEARGALTDEQCDKIEDAHKELMWAQAAVITDKRVGKAQKVLRAAEAREEALLQRFGYTSFGDFKRDRDQVPTEDIHLTLASREFESARKAWVEVQAEIRSSVVVDLTGQEPRVVD